MSYNNGRFPNLLRLAPLLFETGDERQGVATLVKPTRVAVVEIIRFKREQQLANAARTVTLAQVGFAGIAAIAAFVALFLHSGSAT